jgi:hypothetical protein
MPLSRQKRWKRSNIGPAKSATVTYGPSSSTSTVRPDSASVAATTDPPAPEPTTTTSTVSRCPSDSSGHVGTSISIDAGGTNVLLSVRCIGIALLLMAGPAR